MDKFLWGVATAAAQIEGGVLQDGRKLSVWDVLYLMVKVRLTIKYLIVIRYLAGETRS